MRVFFQGLKAGSDRISVEGEKLLIEYHRKIWGKINALAQPQGLILRVQQTGTGPKNATSHTHTHMRVGLL